MGRQIASLSLDLDNKWSYLKTHGNPKWKQFPSYLDVVVPRFLKILTDFEVNITVFVVGQDAAQKENEEALQSISAAGHEIGNHSFHHEPWLHLRTAKELDEELERTEKHLERVTGQKPLGFRGPGFSSSPDLIEVLVSRGYSYDATKFPTVIGPLARAYYFWTARLTKQQKNEREILFGRIRDGFGRLKPHFCDKSSSLVEIPVTTMPLFRIPIHLSYLLYLAKYSSTLAISYFRFSLRLCRLCNVSPSLLLHPLDFLGCDDDSDLAFFPAMNLRSTCKCQFVANALGLLQENYRIVCMREHANEASKMLSGNNGDTE